MDDRACRDPLVVAGYSPSRGVPPPGGGSWPWIGDPDRLASAAAARVDSFHSVALLFSAPCCCAESTQWLWSALPMEGSP